MGLLVSRKRVQREAGQLSRAPCTPGREGGSGGASGSWFWALIGGQGLWVQAGSVGHWGPKHAVGRTGPAPPCFLSAQGLSKQQGKGRPRWLPWPPNRVVSLGTPSPAVPRHPAPAEASIPDFPGALGQGNKEVRVWLCSRRFNCRAGTCAPEISSIYICAVSGLMGGDRDRKVQEVKSPVGFRDLG